MTESVDYLQLWVSLAVLLASALLLLLHRIVWLPYRVVLACKRQGIPFLPFRPLIGQIPELQSQWQVKNPLSPATSAPLGPETVTPLLCDWISRFGTVFGFAAGPQPALVLADPALVQQVLIGRSGCFQKMPAVQRALSFVGDGLPFVDGEEWLRQRKTVNPSFSHGAIKHALGVMNRQARKGVSRLLQRMAQPVGDAADGREAQGAEVEIQEVLFAVTLDVIGLAVLGAAVSGGKGRATAGVSTLAEGGAEEERRTAEEGGAWAEEEAEGGWESDEGDAERKMVQGERGVARIYTALHSLVINAIARFFSGRVFIPLYTVLPMPENRTLWSLEARFRQLFGELIARREVLARGEQASEQGRLGKDILAALLAAEMRSAEGESGGAMMLSGASVNKVVNQCATLIMAGHESVAVLVMWAMYLLARHPQWQERLRNEVLRVVEGAECAGREGEGEGEGENSSSSSSDDDRGSESESDSSTCSSSSTTGRSRRPGTEARAEAGEAGARAVETTWEQAHQLKEQHMVLLETLRLFPPVPVVTRTSVCEVQLGQYTIPKGVDLFLPVGCLHADERYWGKDAREFNPERFKDGQHGVCSHPQAFIPFSSGPRDCVGAMFGLTEAKVILSHLLLNVSWCISPSYQHQPTAALTAQAKHGMQLLFREV